MDYATGKVKKYSREYSRTLKDGTKKKYRTEQVQITIPKQENIFEDEEEVLILTKDNIDNIESNNEIFAALEFQNYLLNQEIAKFTEESESKNTNLEDLNQEVLNLTDNISIKDNEIKDLNQELDKLTDEIIDKNNKIIELNEKLVKLENELKNKSLKDKNDKAKHNLEFLELQKAYIKQLDKIEVLQSELETRRSNELYYKNMVVKLKNFILDED